MKVTATELPEMLKECFQVGITPMVSGSPGLGKSMIYQQVADEFNLELIDVRLSQMDPTELAGFPKLDGDKATYVPMSTFPVKGDPLPKGKDGWLLLMDELNSAALSVQAAAYKLILDKQVGQHDLHPNLVIGAAGNLQTDKAIVTRMSTAMQSRMAHFELTIDQPAWLKWAANNDIDHRIMSFIGFKPGMLYQFKPDHNGSTYPSPRTWEFLSRLVKKYPKQIPATKIALMAAVIDEAGAREFYSYSQIFETLVTVAEITANPMGTKVPDEPSIQYALTGSIAQHMTADNAPKLIQYIERMGAEFQVLCLQQAFGRDKSLVRETVLKNWIKKYSKELF